MRRLFTKWDPILSEPYRLLFPLGLIFAMIGIGVWIPYAILPQSFPYPGQGHAAVQIQGFLYCFILGFLCTMLPKVLGIARLGGFQFSLFVLGLVGFAATAFFQNPIFSQILHLLLILNFLTFVFMGLRKGPARPPSTSPVATSRRQ